MQHLVDSKFNGQIKIKKYLWETSVWVGGFEQSGPLVKAVWKNALKNVTIAPKNVLILGLGCGIAAKLISKKFPNALIIGVEIDPVMIEVGKKYFDLEKIPKLKIVCKDAKTFLGKNKKKFDLILVDVYLGNKPTIFKFLPLTRHGIALINHLEGLKNSVEVLKA